jgi:hypothetical protein
MEEEKMNKNNYTTIKLQKGEVHIYNFGGTKLHAYQTNDPMADEVFILEKKHRAMVVEAPCFADNNAELNNYVRGLSARTEALLLSYHMAGGTFLPDVPVYATLKADEFGHSGGGKSLVDSFTDAFGDAFDPSIHSVTNTISDGIITIAGFELNIIPSSDAFDIEFPEINAVYIHMLGHDCHSIIAGRVHADSLIAQLKDILARGFDLILTSHYTPEDPADVRAKIDYIESVKTLAASSPDAASFKKAILSKYPGYSGDSYLDMTAGFFYPAQD